MKKNAATNLRAMLGVKKDSTPIAHVSPAQQAKMDEEAEWLKTGQFDRLGKIMEDRRRREQDLANQNFGDFFKYWEGLKQVHPGIRVGTLHTITGRQNCGKNFMEEQLRDLGAKLRNERHLTNYSIGHRIGLDRAIIDEALNVDVGMDFSRLENRVGTMHIAKGRTRRLDNIPRDLEVSSLSFALNGVSLHEEFDKMAKHLKWAHAYGVGDQAHRLIGGISTIYNIANGPGGNQVLAERIAVWWEEHKEAYSLPAEITL